MMCKSMKYSISFKDGFYKAFNSVFLITFVLLSHVIYCQEGNTDKGIGSLGEDETYQEVNNEILSYFDFTLNPSFPFNTFNEKYTGNPFGFSAAYLRQNKLGRMTFMGAQFSYAHLGSLTTMFNEFDIRTGTNWMNLQFLYRHFPDFYFWKIEPFFEASFGPQWMYTISTSTLFEDGTTNYDIEESDFALTYAIGFGFTLYIADGFTFLTKANLTSSTALTYFVPGEDLGGFPFDNFNVETSSLNYLQLQFGISYVF